MTFFDGVVDTILLAHEARLKIVGYLSDSPHTVEELAGLVGLSAPTISHHLTKLRNVGLVDSTRDQYYQVYRFLPERLHALSRALLKTPRNESALSVRGSVSEAQAFNEQVMANFVLEGRLV